MDLQTMIQNILQDKNLESGEKAIVALNRKEDAMTEGTYILKADGTLEEACFTICIVGLQPEEVTVQRDSNGGDIV